MNRSIDVSRYRRSRFRVTIVGIIGAWSSAVIWTLTGSTAFTLANALTFAQIWFLMLLLED